MEKKGGDEASKTAAAIGKAIAASFKMETGTFGIEQFGASIQDAMLKQSKDDKQGQMVDLLGAGNKIQEQLLAETKKDKPGALGP
jgi:hypothetical protein